MQAWSSTAPPILQGSLGGYRERLTDSSTYSRQGGSIGESRCCGIFCSTGNVDTFHLLCLGHNRELQRLWQMGTHRQAHAEGNKSIAGKKVAMECEIFRFLEETNKYLF